MTYANFTRSAFLAAFALALPAGAAVAHDGVTFTDAYVRSAPPTAPTGGAFMKIENHRDVPVHITGVSSDVAARVELHTHIQSADGVMKMVHVEEGFTIPAGATFMLERGGNHVMFMGLHKPLEQGTSISVTFEFEGFDDQVVDVVVDHTREEAPAGEGAMDHDAMMSEGTMDHGAMSNGAMSNGEMNHGAMTPNN